ncbi:sensor histidine kinase [Nitrincola tapanii]|uniref:histidine kinase n=1 Tax=Nitrincola tapanii TaxID=1708751 RepID=A0A5A9W0D8_9GAMM|nr:PAS domain-containing sensor histidine kinase [Nitrincola tapanii]KAA0873585.1 PAS domain-containing sensor histidine kinase [Nitrincola tapanii]
MRFEPVQEALISTSDESTQSKPAVVEHYLKTELYQSISSNFELIDFLQEAALDGVWYWDIEHPEQEWMSPRFWQTLGYDPEEKQHCSSEWQSLIHPDDLISSNENLRKHFADPNHPYDQIVRYRHKQGGTVWVRCRGKAIRCPEGRPIRMLGAHTDVTELKEAEQALQRSHADLEHFAYVISHDFRQPLRMISRYLQLLERQLPTDLTGDAATFLKNAKEGTQRMDQMLESWLQYARLTESQTDVSCCDSDQAVQDALECLAAKIEQTQAQITFHSTTWPKVRIRHEELVTVFQNLIENALKYSWLDQPPQIELDVEHRGMDWRFSVRDYGIGIESEQKERVFKLFQRLHDRKQYQGHGVGLSICQKIIHNRGGNIGFESNENAAGTCFFFTLAAVGPDL